MDLACAVRMVTQFMENPYIVPWQALKWILIYLSGSLKNGLKYTKAAQEEDDLEGYVDKDYAGNVDTRKSLLGCVDSLWHDY